MLTQKEKFQALESAFPHIPARHKSRIAQRLTELGNVYGVVRAYIRHSMTNYDTILTGAQYYGAMRTEAREIVSNEVLTILEEWK